MKISGKNVLFEALKHDAPVKEVFILKGENESLKEFALKKNIIVREAKKEQLDKDFGAGHQGIGAYVEDYKYMDLHEVLEMKKNLHVIILDEIEDPHNLGAIIRTANASGVDAVIIPKDRSASVNQTVVKTSTGAVYSTNIVMVNNLNNCIEQLKNHDVTVIGTDANTDKYYTDVDMTGSVAIVIGSEGFGMRKLVKKNCNELVKIPMNGSVTSLNASVSAALLMYEVLRQRN